MTPASSASSASSAAPSPVARAVLHPATLASLAVLLLNDHLLKPTFPSALTGKLSDFAGLAFLPVVVAFALRGRTTRAVVLAALAVGAAFAAVKLSTAACDVYATLLGRLQWLAALPGWLPGWLAHGASVPDSAQATVMRDPTDLVALPFLLVGVAITRAEGRPKRAESPSPGAHAPTHCAHERTTHIGPP